MNIYEQNGLKIGVIDKNIFIKDAGEMLDLMGNAYYNECVGIVIKKESLTEDFFELKTKIAGEILQKFSNYKMKVAIIGDYSVYNSKALKDFIYESNKGSMVKFASTKEEAYEWLFRV